MVEHWVNVGHPRGGWIVAARSQASGLCGRADRRLLRRRTAGFSNSCRSSDELTDSTPLITGGVLDSIATLKLVLFLEERFGVTLEPHEVDPEHLDTTACIEQLVLSKIA